jgi:hypothetical protein
MIRCIIQGFSMYKKFIDLKKSGLCHGLINWLLFTVCYKARTACTYMYSSTLCRLNARVMYILYSMLGNDWITDIRLYSICHLRHFFYILHTGTEHLRRKDNILSL